MVTASKLNFQISSDNTERKEDTFSTSVYLFSHQKKKKSRTEPLCRGRDVWLTVAPIQVVYDHELLQVALNPADHKKSLSLTVRKL